MSRLRERTTANLLILMAVVMFIPAVMAKGGFDQWGYNYNARIFNGWARNYYAQQSGSDPPLDNQERYFDEMHLVMQWDKLWDAAKFGPDDIRDNGDELDWSPGARCTNTYRYTESSGKTWFWYYRFVVAPLNEPPSDDAQDLHWGYPIAEDGTVLCFWAIFRVEGGTGPYLGPANPNGPGAYK